MAKLKTYTSIRTGKLNANASSENGNYPFFTCSKEILTIDTYSYDCECVLVAGNGDLNVKYYKGKFDAYQRTYILESTDKNKLNVMYLYYFLCNYVDKLRQQSIGGVIKYIKLGNLEEANIPLLSINEQIKIVNILSKLDYLIKLQNKALFNLNQLVLSRFTELFGDICKNNKQWNIINLGDLFKVSSSKRIYQNEHMKKGVPFFRIADLMKKISTGSCSTEIFISDNKYNELKNSGYVPKSGDILLTSRGTLGECYVITKDDKFYFQDGMISWLSPIDKNININYIVHLFCMPEFKKQFSNHTSGSTVDYLSIENIRRLRIPLPNNNLQNKFDKDVHKIDKSKIADLITFLLRLNLKLLRLIFKLLG